MLISICSIIIPVIGMIEAIVSFVVAMFATYTILDITHSRLHKKHVGVKMLNVNVKRE